MKMTQLQQGQVGNETTRGTAVEQTKELAGITSLNITPANEPLASKEIGSLAQSVGNVVIGKIDGTASLDGYISYEQLPLYFDSLFGTATPTGADPYVYTYNAPNTSTATRRFFTLTKGDTDDANALTGAVLSSLTLTYEPNAFITMSGEFVGHHVEDDTLASLTKPTVTFPDNSQTTFSMGDYGGSLSALNCNVRSATFEINTNTTNHMGIGNLGACDFEYGDIEGKLTLVANADYSVLKTVFEGMLGASPTVQRKEFQLNTTDGTNIIDIDFSGYLENAPELYGDTDGIATVELVFITNFDSSTNLTSWCDVSITNGEASMF